METTLANSELFGPAAGRARISEVQRKRWAAWRSQWRFRPGRQTTMIGTPAIAQTRAPTWRASSRLGAAWKRATSFAHAIRPSASAAPRQSVFVPLPLSVPVEAPPWLRHRPLPKPVPRHGAPVRVSAPHGRDGGFRGVAAMGTVLLPRSITKRVETRFTP